MTYSNNITIGPEFFAKAKNDYSDWQWSLAREFCQNCIDAPGTDTIIIDATEQDGETLLTVTNNGEPMSREILTEKLLSLGSSGKDFQGTVGGFGKAKELLYYSHRRYVILTGNFKVTGSGAGYNLEEVENFKGTTSQIWLEGECAKDILDKFRLFFALSGWRGTALINNEVFSRRTNLGAYRREMDWCKIHTNKSWDGLMIVRMGTMPMFTRRISHNGCVVVTMDGASAKYLQSSRDGLKWSYQRELDDFVVSLAVNKRSAFRQKEAKKSKYDGYKLVGRAKTNLTNDDLVSSVESTGDQEEVLEERITAALAANPEITRERAVRVIETIDRMAFTIKDESGMTIPKYYLPDHFSSYARALAERWASMLIELAIQEENTTPFSIGFIFADDRVAEYEREGDEHTLYINPVIIKEAEGKARSMSRRWTFNNSGNWDLVATAAHEFVHLMGQDSHDEDFALRLTKVMGQTLANRAKFGTIFSGGGKVKWS